MDRYFYILEEENGKRVIHMQGNVYYNNADGSNKKYQSAEWTSLYFDIDEAQLMLDTDTFYEFINARVDYIRDYAEIEASYLCKNYFNGQPGAELHILDITNKTPCGEYWFDKEQKGNAELSKNKELKITFHNPNNEKDSRLIAENFISHAAQKIVWDYVINQNKIIESEEHLNDRPNEEKK